MKYAVVFEKADKNYSAYVPDLPGCIATGDTLAEAKQLIQEAIEFHLEGMVAEGMEIPAAETHCAQVEIDLAKIKKTRRKASSRR